MSPIAYSPKVTYSGLVGYWDAANVKSYPGSGTIWRDLSGNGNHGTLSTGSIGTVSGSGVMAFDGSSDNISVSDSNSLDFGSGSFSAEFFINFPYLPSGGNGAILVKGNVGSGNSWAIRTSGTNGLHYTENEDAFTNVIAAGLANGITHIVMIKNVINNKIYCYANNVLVGDVAYSTPYDTDTSSALVVSSNAGGWLVWKSFLFYGLKIYSKALSQSEITQNFNAHRSRYNI